VFTGIVETTGAVLAFSARPRGRRLALKPAKPLRGVKLGESIAVNGVCLTVAALGTGGRLEFDVIRETLRMTNLGGLAAGTEVNLERALKFGDRLSGHYVMGHVDARAKVLAVARTARETEVRVEVPARLSRWIVLKGCIAVDGVSLTVSRRTARDFSVHIIPHTWAETTLKNSAVGAYVNLETDILLKVPPARGRSGPGQKLFSYPRPRRRR
jgi:riboflavin synthase